MLDVCSYGRGHLGLPNFVINAAGQKAEEEEEQASCPNCNRKDGAFLLFLILSHQISLLFLIRSLFKSMQIFLFLSHFFSQTVCRIHGSFKEREERQG